MSAHGNKLPKLIELHEDDPFVSGSLGGLGRAQSIGGNKPVWTSEHDTNPMIYRGFPFLVARSGGQCHEAVFGHGLPADLGLRQDHGVGVNAAAVANRISASSKKETVSPDWRPAITRGQHPRTLRDYRQSELLKQAETFSFPACEL
jgi:hypothetical protein